MLIENWRDLSEEQISLAAIKRVHQPNDHFLFRFSSYLAGTQAAGGSRDSYVYPLKGAAKYWNSNQTIKDAVEVEVGKRLKIDISPVNFKVDDAADFEYILVWKLPLEYRGKVVP